MAMHLKKFAHYTFLRSGKLKKVKTVLRSMCSVYGTAIFIVMLTIPLTRATGYAERMDFTAHKTRKYGELHIIANT